MKKFAVLLALASSSAFAQDLMLGDLNFFQKAGSWRYNTELSFTRADSEDDSKAEYRTNSLIWDNAVTYGLSDKLNVGLGVDWAIKNSTTNNKVASGPKDKKTTEEGLGDFRILGNYRLMSDKLFVDLVGGLTLGLADREMAGATNAGESEGNYNQGHHSLDLAVAVGQKMANNWEWRAIAGLDYHLSGDGSIVEKGTRDTDFDSDSYIDWRVGAAAQYRQSKKWAYAASFDYIIPGDQTLDIKNAGDADFETDNYWVLGLTAKHNFSETALLTVGYSLRSEFDQDQKFGGAKSTTEFDMAHKITVGGQFLF